MSGHPQATGLYGAPKLLWRPDVQKPVAQTLWRRTSRCGLYRIELVTGVKEPVFVAVYQPAPSDWDSIAVERTEAAALDWVRRDHARRCALQVQEMAA